MDFGISMWMVWIILTVVLAIVEIFTSMVIAMCIAVGSFVAFVVSLFGVSFETQVIALVIATVVAFVGLMPVVRRFKSLQGAPGDAISNMDALIGREVTVAADIPAGQTGRVKIDGDSWQARTVGGEPVMAGGRVKVCGYDSIVLIVEPLN